MYLPIGAYILSLAIKWLKSEKLFKKKPTEKEEVEKKSTQTFSIPSTQTGPPVSPLQIPETPEEISWPASSLKWV